MSDWGGEASQDYYLDDGGGTHYYGQPTYEQAVQAAQAPQPAAPSSDAGPSSSPASSYSPSDYANAQANYQPEAPTQATTGTFDPSQVASSSNPNFQGQNTQYFDRTGNLIGFLAANDNNPYIASTQGVNTILNNGQKITTNTPTQLIDSYGNLLYNNPNYVEGGSGQRYVTRNTGDAAIGGTLGQGIYSTPQSANVPFWQTDAFKNFGKSALMLGGGALAGSALGAMFPEALEGAALAAPGAAGEGVSGLDSITSIMNADNGFNYQDFLSNLGSKDGFDAISNVKDAFDTKSFLDDLYSTSGGNNYGGVLDDLGAADVMGSTLSDSGAADLMGEDLSDIGKTAQSLGYTTADDAIADGFMTEDGYLTDSGAERLMSNDGFGLEDPFGEYDFGLTYGGDWFDNLLSDSTATTAGSGSGLSGLARSMMRSSQDQNSRRRKSNSGYGSGALDYSPPGPNSIANPKSLLPEPWKYGDASANISPETGMTASGAGGRHLSSLDDKLAEQGYTYLKDGGQPDSMSQEPQEHNPEFFSEGGLRHTYAKGRGDGTSDSVPAMLATGEFVIPADVVANLGNGDNEAGAGILDKFLYAIRQHKRSASPDELPPDSKGPLAYLGEAYNKARA